MQRRRPKVMLVTPPYHSGVVESAGTWLPLHFVYLAGHARNAGAEVYLYDAMSLQHTHDDIRREIESFGPDILGVTAITAMEPDAREVCATAKALDSRTLTVMGNVHPSFMWRQLLGEDANVDLVIRGEGEETLADLVRAVSAGDANYAAIPGVAGRRDGVVVSGPARPFAGNLDDLMPAWDLVDWAHYAYRPSPEGRLAIVSSSRGCQQHCAFCSQQQFWERTWRQRSAEHFVSELEMLRDRFDVRVAMLSDETPTVDAERWQRILDLLIERQVGTELLLETRVVDILRDEAILDKYARAGVSHIYVGVEATDQEKLDLFEKETKVAESRRCIQLINQHDIVSETSFVLGTPDETPEKIAATVALARDYGPDLAFFLAIAPWPYAGMWQDLEPYVKSRDYRRYNLVEAVVEPERMTLAEVNKALGHASRDFYMHRLGTMDRLTEHKREFLLKVMKIMMNHSYLSAHMKQAGDGMPEHVRRMLARYDAI